MNPITELLEELRTKLPAASRVITEGAGSETSQASLTGPLSAVASAVRATPNSSNMFPSRESYLQYGYAIKAALPDDEPAAFDLFSEWCARWAEGENDPDVVAADWRRMKAPFRRGASWLFETAEQYGHFDRASVWFEPITDEAGIWPAEEPTAPTDVYPLLTLDEIIARPPPKMLVARHIPEIGLGFLYSVPGAGKSFIAQDIGLTIASALADWHGDTISTDPDAVVLYIAAEGSYGLRNRVKAWAKAKGLPDLPKRFLVIEKTINFMKAEDVDRLLRTVRAVAGRRPCLVVVDTVSRAMPGADENLQKEMTLFVEACDKLRDAFRCAVLGVHHAGKNGDMRGSTVLNGAGDFVFRLERKQGATIGHLHCEKQKDAPDGWSEPYGFTPVEIGDGESSLVVSREEMSVGPSMELTPHVAAAVLEAMRAAWDEGGPWCMTPQAKERYAVRKMVADFGFDAVVAGGLLQGWERDGTIITDMRDAKRRRSGFKVLIEHRQNVLETGVFD